MNGESHHNHGSQALISQRQQFSTKHRFEATSNRNPGRTVHRTYSGRKVCRKGERTKNHQDRDLPGVPGKIPPFQCRGRRFNPRSGNKDPTCFAAQSKNNLKKKKTRTNFGNKEMPHLPEPLQYEIRMTLLQRQTQINGKSRELGRGLANVGMQRVSKGWGGEEPINAQC